MSTELKLKELNITLFVMIVIGVYFLIKIGGWIINYINH